MNDNFDLMLKEAHRILDANPKLKSYEALFEAKKNIKEKELSDGRLKTLKG